GTRGGTWLSKPLDHGQVNARRGSFQGYGNLARSVGVRGRSVFPRLYLPEERKRRGFADRDPPELANQALGPFELANVVRWRTAGQLQRTGRGFVFERRLARPFHEDLDGFADPAEVIAQADLILDRQQVVVAAFLDFLRHVVGKELVSLRTGPGA